MDLAFYYSPLLVKANKKDRKTENKPQEVVAPPSDCCGAHEICEFDQMKMNESVIEYYDDEELDAYKNIDEDSYTNNQIELPLPLPIFFSLNRKYFGASLPSFLFNRKYFYLHNLV